MIVNPNNGPGPDSLPDANYIRAIPRLSSHANVHLLGYVHTSYATRNIASICRDIETYAAWPINSSSPALAVRGIFFDETPQQYDVHSAAYLQQLTQFVKGLNTFSPNPYVGSQFLFCLLPHMPAYWIHCDVHNCKGTGSIGLR